MPQESLYNQESLNNIKLTTFQTCEEMHATNLHKLLPYSFMFDSLNANDPFLFLFKSDKITVNIKSHICSKIIAQKYNIIVDICLRCVRLLRLTTVTPATFNSTSSTSQTSTSTSSTATLAASIRCIQNIILWILPRLAYFDKETFNNQYMKDTLSFLSQLNTNASFITPTMSTTGAAGSTTTTTATSSATATHVAAASLKSEIIFCMGFLALALGDKSVEFRAYSMSFIEQIQTSPFVKAGNVHSTNFNLNNNLSSSQNSNNSNNTGFIMLPFAELQSMQTINELNSIMACIAMFAKSMVKDESETSSMTLASLSSTVSSSSSSDFSNLVMELLEPLMICSGGVTYTMRYCLNEICEHIPQLKTSIHENLLKILSQILTGRPLFHIIKVIASSASHLIRSNNYYSFITNGMISSRLMNSSGDDDTSGIDINDDTLIDNNLEFEKCPTHMDTNVVVQALQTLRSFQFSSIYVIAFLRYCVDFYLHHDNRHVKIEAILTTSHLLSLLIATLDEQESRALITIISCALRKLLICAITDYDADVRYHVLNSLDNDVRFNMFVALPENLNILFMCVRDERLEIRELSASMVSRLSASNSAYILPFIRKILMQLLTEVEIYPDISHREKSVRLMGHLLSHAPQLVNLYVKSLLDCLHSKLNEHRRDIPFASSIVTVVGQLASQSNAESIVHFDTIIPFLIDSMQDFYYIQLKHTALWALSQIIANTGYVIEPYKKYPNLLGILLDFLQTETVTEIRRETVRIIGLIGAIDPFELRKTIIKSKQDELENATASAAKKQQKKQNLILSTTVGAIGAATAIDNKNDVQLPNVGNLQPGVTAAEQAATAAANIANKDDATAAGFDPIEMLLSVNYNLEEYYPTLAIHLIMKMIKNSVSVNARLDAVHALVMAMRTLDTRCVKYVQLVIPPFLDLIKKMNDNLVTDLILNLGDLVSYIKKHIEPYLTDILDVIEWYWNLPDKQAKFTVALIDLIQSIANVMDIEFKRYLPRVLPLILKKFQQEIEKNNKSWEKTRKILHLVRSCTGCLENYVHLILSQFAEYLTLEDQRYLLVKQDIMFTLYTFARQITLSDNCAILFQSFIKILEQSSNDIPVPSSSILLNSSLIVQSLAFNHEKSNNNTIPDASSIMTGSAGSSPVFSITYLLFSHSTTTPASLTNEKINESSNLSLLTIETLYLLARQMSGRFFVYAPMFDRILIRNKSYSKLYDLLMVYCRESTIHTIRPHNVNAPVDSAQSETAAQQLVNEYLMSI
jgi:hypothetical protein